MEKFEPLSEQLAREVNSNKVDGEEPPQNRKEKRSLQDQLEELKKKKKKKIFMLLKNVIRKTVIQVVVKTCTPGYGA